ncbi:MAG: DUF2213 domain-containing protein [Steroidobacteraceae bacterium]
METSVSRYDFAPITGSETTSEGYLRVWCRAARTGTQLYRRADGTQVREYRPPEEVSNPEALSTFGMKPVTWGHPPVLLDAANTKQFQTGYSGSQVRYNDGFVEVALVVTDQDAIEKIKRKDATEVSAGYKVDFDPTPGITPEGESYDGVQRNIRVNHIAIVPRGRAGPEVRLLLDRMDAADAVADFPEHEMAPQSSSTASPVMATVKLDGLEIDLPAEAASAVQSYSRDMGRQLQALTTERDELVAKLDSLQADFDSLALDKEAAEGRADALEEELASTESGRIDTAELDQLVAERLSTLQRLAPAFAEDFKFDGIDDASLFIQAFENLTGSAPREDAEPAYIQGVVEGILAARADTEDEEGDEEEYFEDGEADTKEDSADREDSTSTLRDALKGAGRGTASPVQAYRAKQAEAWKRPLTATK